MAAKNCLIKTDTLKEIYFENGPKPNYRAGHSTRDDHVARGRHSRRTMISF